MSVLYQNAYQVVSLPIYESDGSTLVDATTLAEAEVRIYPVDSCTAAYTASLGGELTVVGTTLTWAIPENNLTISGTNGEYKLVLRKAYSAGELGPPDIDQIIDIIPVCPIP